MHSTVAPQRPDDKAAASSGRRIRYRPNLERCESRVLLTTYTVNALTDTGAGNGTAGDLRYCIKQANADGQQDAITFAVAGTIQLGSALPPLAKARGLAIAGPGAGSLTIRGGGAAANFTIFRVNPGDSAAISGVTIANGAAPQSGGGVFNLGTLTLTGVTFAGNSSRRNGGAINNTGTLTVANSTLVDNSTSGLGGAINNYGTLTVSDSTISGNSAFSAGGGVDSAFGVVKITDTVLDNNSAGAFGGGISLNGPADLTTRGGTLLLFNSELNNNVAGMTPREGYGGGLAANDSEETISGSSFNGNSAGREAGGIGINGGDLSLDHSNLTANATNGRGGGISINGGVSVTGRNTTNGATMTVDHSTFTANTAGRDGGGIQATEATLKVADASLAANTAGTFGGGISLSGDARYNVTQASLKLANSTVSGNTAGQGGGGISNFAHLTLIDTNVTGNLANVGGGGLYDGKTPIVRGSTIAGNQPDDTAVAR